MDRGVEARRFADAVDVAASGAIRPGDDGIAAGGEVDAPNGEVAAGGDIQVARAVTDDTEEHAGSAAAHGQARHRRRWQLDLAQREQVADVERAALEREQARRLEVCLQADAVAHAAPRAGQRGHRRSVDVDGEDAAPVDDVELAAAVVGQALGLLELVRQRRDRRRRRIVDADGGVVVVADVEPLPGAVEGEARRPVEERGRTVAVAEPGAARLPGHGRDPARCQVDLADRVVAEVGHVESALPVEGDRPGGAELGGAADVVDVARPPARLAGHRVDLVRGDVQATDRAGVADIDVARAVPGHSVRAREARRGADAVGVAEAAVAAGDEGERVLGHGHRRVDLVRRAVGRHRVHVEDPRHRRCCVAPVGADLPRAGLEHRPRHRTVGRERLRLPEREARLQRHHLQRRLRGREVAGVRRRQIDVTVATDAHVHRRRRVRRATTGDDDAPQATAHHPQQRSRQPRHCALSE